MIDETKEEAQARLYNEFGKEEKKYKLRDRQPKKIENDDMTAILKFATNCLKKSSGRYAIYDNNDEGLELFRKKTIEYFQYLDELNQDVNQAKKIVPEIESWCLYLGISRTTLFKYVRRNDYWQETIEEIKGAILTCKKQLANTGKMAPVVFIFDACNNYGYQNTSMVQVEKVTSDEKQAITADELREKLGLTTKNAIDVDFREIEAEQKKRETAMLFDNETNE